MAKPVDVLDEIIAQLDPEEVPVEFIVMAQVTYLDGEKKTISGSELEIILEDPAHHNVAEARVILDVHKIRSAICETVDQIFAQANALDPGSADSK